MPSAHITIKIDKKQKIKKYDAFSVLSCHPKYKTNHKNVHDISNIGVSLITFEKKYTVGEYVSLICSLTNTGFSSGKSTIIFCIVMKKFITHTMNKSPFLLCIDCSSIPSWPQASSMIIVIIQNPIILVIPASGILTVSLQFLKANNQN